jgi:plasmid stabilization system protein ParE
LATVDLSARAKKDLERIFDFLAETDLRRANEACGVILDAFEILKRHPLIGNSVNDTLRKLVISYGKTGYVALYHYVGPTKDDIDGAVLITNIRHQRESGFAD